MSEQKAIQQKKRKGIVRVFQTPTGWEVSEWLDGTLTCNCPDFCKSKKHKGKPLEFREPCKHIRRVQEEHAGYQGIGA
jgi:predicted nucleic acid-binding Zn finger protein